MPRPLLLGLLKRFLSAKITLATTGTSGARPGLSERGANVDVNLPIVVW